MNKEIVKKCYGTADKIVGMLTELGYSSERKLTYENELRDIIAIELQRNITDIATIVFYDTALTGCPAPEVNEETNDNPIT